MTKRGKGFKRRHNVVRLRRALTRRETEVVKGLAKGYLPPEVAKAMGVSTNTIRTHQTNIMVKLGLHSRSQLVAWYWAQASEEWYAALRAVTRAKSLSEAQGIATKALEEE